MSSPGEKIATIVQNTLDAGARIVDTTGSARRPALVNGVFQMRPSYDAASLAGIVPVFTPWDAPALFTRDVKFLKRVVSTWRNQETSLTRTPSHKAPLIVYPLDYFPLENTLQMQLIDAFLTDLADVLGAQIRKFSIASLWEETRPDVAAGQSVQDYLGDTYVHTTFHNYYYNSIVEFRTTYERAISEKALTLSLSSNGNGDLGKSVTRGSAR
ncbi:MAG: hypothetical protein L6R40_001244 [Gallowayella cf. fulva]|nr:MAG: hypothetical protein L6R40_001244 [Xanthomendoza cf. fulva]